MATIFYLAHPHDADRVKQDRQNDQSRAQSSVARLHDALPMRLGLEATVTSSRSSCLRAAKRVMTKAFLKVDGAARNTNEI
ncbi:hypothetical protein [Bosea sp. CRIB-10]|uniref:hypothetical protein n=1 Tax=Bosea sp. CRIB-10 TaxID=378404 RepID=UPI0011134D79|nr:hypothetical protein [Bosea sp. CRIB-10]